MRSAHGLQSRLAAGTTAALLAGLLVLGDPLDILGQAFLLAHLLKPPEHLFGGLVAARLHPDHAIGPFSRIFNNLSRRNLQSANDEGSEQQSPVPHRCILALAPYSARCGSILHIARARQRAIGVVEVSKCRAI